MRRVHFHGRGVLSLSAGPVTTIHSPLARLDSAPALQQGGRSNLRQRSPAAAQALVATTVAQAAREAGVTLPAQRSRKLLDGPIPDDEGSEQDDDQPEPDFSALSLRCARHRCGAMGATAASARIRFS